MKVVNKSLKVNFLYNISYQLLAILVPIITTPYIARILQADGIGIYSYTLSIVTYFGLIGTLGVNSYGQLKIAANRDNKCKISKLFWEIFLARLLTMCISGVIYFIFICLTPRYKEVYLILYMVLLSQVLDISWLFQGLEEFKKTVTRNFIVKITSTVLIFLLVKKKADIYIYILIVHGSVLIGNLTLWTYVKEFIGCVKLKELKIIHHWKNSIVYFIPTIATSIYTVLDKSMIGTITGSVVENGYYDQAYKIESILLAVVTSLGTVTLPRLTYLFKGKNINKAKEIMNVTLNYILILTMPMMFGLIAISENLIPIFLGNGYEKSIVLLKIFSILLVVIGLDDAIGRQCLMATGRQKYFNRCVIIGAIVNLLINLILIPKMGSVGAAIASVCAEISILSGFVYYSKDLINIKEIFKSFVKYFIISLLMYIVISLISHVMYFENLISMILKIFIGVIFYILILFFCKDSFFIEFFRKYKK